MFPVEWVADGTNLTRTRRAENWSHRQLHLARLDGADGASVAFSGDPRCRYLIIITATVSMDEWTRSILPVLLISSIRSRFLQQISNARLTPPAYSLLIFLYIIQPYSTIIFFHWRSSLHSVFFFFLSSEVSCSICVFLRKIIHLLPSLHCRKLHFCSLSSGPLSCVVILLFSPFILEINICFKFCSCCSSCVCKVFWRFSSSVVEI